jgi:hypothetical protein
LHTLLALSLLLSAPAGAEDDLIAQWLQQDEARGQAQDVRPDLNAITDEQWSRRIQEHARIRARVFLNGLLHQVESK